MTTVAVKTSRLCWPSFYLANRSDDVSKSSKREYKLGRLSLPLSLSLSLLSTRRETEAQRE